MSGGVQVWCLRHAESLLNVTAGVAGVAPMAPLTARGRRQAIAAAQTLAGEPITRIYTSTALRARQTAEILATVLTVDVVALPELVEVDVGEHVLHAWVVEQDLGLRAADGESGCRVVARITAAFQQIASAHPGETVSVVGHVASLTVALGRLCALGATIWGTPLPHASPFLVEWDGHAWQCPAWPDPAMPPEWSDPLYLAVRSGDLARVKALAATETDAARLAWALVEAVQDEHEEVALYLLSLGADVHLRGPHPPWAVLNWTALHAAARQFNLRLAAVLLDHGASVDARSPQGVTPLLAAMDELMPWSQEERDLDDPMHLAMIELLLRRGADPNASNASGSTALDMLRGVGPGGIKLYRLLRRFGATDAP